VKSIESGAQLLWSRYKKNRKMQIMNRINRTELTRALALLCASSLVLGNAVLRADDAPPSPPPFSDSSQPAVPAAAALTPDQIDSMVAPIALYPDELVSQVLVASTYPLEIVQAYQWMQQRPDLKGKDLAAAAQQQSWDPSIQALVAFPDVMKRMNQDVTWTTNLGNAFLANQAGVMDEIQKMRARAEAAGKLASTEQQNVINTTDNGQPVVQIEPADPEVVYVPDYNPVWIWGPASAYYPYPYWYYPPEPPYGVWCWWGAAITMGVIFAGWNGWGGWGWHPGWGGHTIAMNHEFFAGNHFHEAHFVNDRGAAVWAHDPGHRIGVAYPNRGLAGHFNQFARPAPARVTVNQVREQLSRPAARVETERIGGRQISSGGFSRNRTVFGGVEAGSAARTHSDRGFSSLSRVQPSSGGNRGGAIPSGGNRGGGNSGGGSRGGSWGGRK
jgi:hypothetical protein